MDTAVEMRVRVTMFGVHVMIMNRTEEVEHMNCLTNVGLTAQGKKGIWLSMDQYGNPEGGRHGRVTKESRRMVTTGKAQMAFAITAHDISARVFD